MRTAKGAIPSPNIWQTPQIYEIENKSLTPAGLLEDTMRQIADWKGRDVIDIGCGTGFHLPTFAETAATVTGVEPHAGLLKLAGRRVRRLPNVHLLQGSAQDLPLPPASVDVAHARWAYFFGPGCEPGLAELNRVMRRGGTAFIIDNDASRSTFGQWFRRGYPWLPDPRDIERFWVANGFQQVRMDLGWAMGNRADFEAVVRIEFDPDTAAAIIAEHPGTSVDYAVNLWVRHY